MKKLEELGISPAPWECATNDRGEFIGTLNGRGFYVAKFSYDITPNDARLIAAAPELYKFLREAVVENCHDCGNLDNEMSAYQDDFVCHNDKCFVKRWRAALAKAAGEEVADGK